MRLFGSSRALGLGQAVVFVLALLVAALLPASASAEPSFAPADEATVHPGVITTTEGGGSCTSNFVFTNGTDVFLGQAAHCAGTGLPTEFNGCMAESVPLGTPVEVEGASQPGTLVYSSWLAMQANGETDTNACMFNDFA
ncbi:MAG: serine protease, partial [Actinomycetota bacterium]|nr:serine protease [Actinomycetota bacterium]